MLHVQGNKVGVPVQLLVPDFFPSEKSLYQKLWRYKDANYGPKRLQRGCNSRQLLVDFDTLPREVQQQIGDPRKPAHLLDKFYQTDAEAVDYYHNYQYPDGSYLKPDACEQYIINASVMKAIFKLRDARIAERMSKPNGSLQGITQSLCTDAITYQDHLIAKVGRGHKLPTNARRFKEAMTAFERIGFQSLIKDAKGNAKKNAAKVNEKVLQLLNDLFASQSHKPTATEVAGQYDAFLRGQLDVVNSETGELYTTDGYASISTSTVKRYLAQWQNRIITHSRRSGDRQVYQQKFKPHHGLEQPQFAGSALSIDDRNPPFKALETGKRPWFYNGIDLASEAFTVWVYGDSKEGIILDFYRQLVRNYHEWNLPLPAGLECESSLNSSFKDTFLREGQMFEHVRIEANNARGKRIERYFGALRYGLEKKREGWLARPHASSESNQAGAEAVQMLPYQHIIEGCLEDICTWNNMEHSKIKGKTRWEVFMESQNPDLKPTNYKAILPYLGYATQTSCNAGMINFRSRKYLLGVDGEVATGDTLIRLMKEVEGEDFTIYWLDDNQGKPFKALIYKHDRFVCEAVPQPTYSRAKAEMTPEGEAARATMSSYVNTVESYRKQGVKQLNKVEVLDNRSLTLNNKFHMPGAMAKHRPIEQETEAAEILPELPEQDDFYENAIQTSNKRSLKDRF